MFSIVNTHLNSGLAGLHTSTLSITLPFTLSLTLSLPLLFTFSKHLQTQFKHCPVSCFIMSQWLLNILSLNLFGQLNPHHPQCQHSHSFRLPMLQNEEAFEEGMNEKRWRWRDEHCSNWRCWGCCQTWHWDNWGGDLCGVCLLKVHLNWEFR